MLKRLAVNYWPMILLGILIGAVFYMSRYAENRKADHQENTQASSPKASLSPNHAGQSTQNANKPQHYPSWIDTFSWPQGATVWALFLTLLVIGWQSTETRNAAQAALLNAQAVINAERPWIVMVVEPHATMGGFAIHVKNKGRTPARVVAAYIGWDAVEGISNLPQDPPYRPGSLMQDRMVVADETVWAVWFHREMMRKDFGDDFEKALNGKRPIFVFGKVLYRDVLNPETILPYETRWIGLFEINEEGDAFHRAEGIGAAPKGYEKYT